jgi:cbb3-type cytochrome oxidase maturation protein
MSVLILLIAFSILIASGFLIAFIWSVKKGQYDDDYTPSVRMLFDDKPIRENKTLVPKQK